jgi:hypothetical protein
MASAGVTGEAIAIDCPKPAAIARAMINDRIDINQFMFRIPVVVSNIDLCNLHDRIHLVGPVLAAPQHATIGLPDAS